MSDKLKYNLSRDAEDFQEFPMRVVRILLPNDMEFTLQYDPHGQGLIINKAFGTKDDEDSSMSITMKPRVSNEILIK